MVKCTLIGIAILGMGLGLSGCAHESVKTQFVSATPLTVTSLTDQSKEETFTTTANQPFELKGSYARIEEKGRLPLLVVSPNPTATTGSAEHPIEVTLRPVADWKSEATDQYISGQVDVLYIDLLQIIAYAKDRKTELSLKKIDSVIEKFPKLASAYYVKAQVQVLAGHPSDALASLDIATKLRPGFVEAQALQEQLKGKR